MVCRAYVMHVFAELINFIINHDSGGCKIFRQNMKKNHVAQRNRVTCLLEKLRKGRKLCHVNVDLCDVTEKSAFLLHNIISLSQALISWATNSTAYLLFPIPTRALKCHRSPITQSSSIAMALISTTKRKKYETRFFFSKN